MSSGSRSRTPRKSRAPEHDGSKPGNRRCQSHPVVAVKHQLLQRNPTTCNWELKDLLSPPPESTKKRGKSDIRRSEPKIKSKENSPVGHDQATKAVTNSKLDVQKLTSQPKMEGVVEQEPKIDKGIRQTTNDSKSSEIENQGNSAQTSKGLGLFSGITGLLNRLFVYWNWRTKSSELEEACNTTPDNKPQANTNSSRESSTLKSILKSPSISFQVYPSDDSDSEIEWQYSTDDEISDNPNPNFLFRPINIDPEQIVTINPRVASRRRVKLEIQEIPAADPDPDRHKSVTLKSPVPKLNHSCSGQCKSNGRKKKEHLPKPSRIALVKPLIFTCPLCPQSFTKMEHSKNHIFKWHKLNTQPHFCGVCGLGFLHETGLQEHALRHFAHEVQIEDLPNGSVSDDDGHSPNVNLLDDSSPSMSEGEPSPVLNDSCNTYENVQLPTREENGFDEEDPVTSGKETGSPPRGECTGVKYSTPTKKCFKSNMEAEPVHHQFDEFQFQDRNSHAKRIVFISSYSRLPVSTEIQKMENTYDDAADEKPKSSRQSLSRSCKRSL